MVVGSLFGYQTFKTKTTTMKKLAFLFMTVCALLAFVPSRVQAAAEKDKAPIAVAIPDKSVRTPEAKALITRLDEIKAMDKSTLSPAEKRELRQETRAIKSTVNKMEGDVIYISAGGLLLVLLLVIILF